MPSTTLSSNRSTCSSPSYLYTEHDVIWYGISLWPAVLAMLPPTCLYTFSVSRAWEAEKVLDLLEALQLSTLFLY